MIERINNFDLKILLSLNGFLAKHGGFWDKFLAEYLTYFLPLILVILWFWNEKAKKVALRGLFAAILAWPVLAAIIGKIVNRPRPFNISGVQELVFHRPDVSFPSEHSAALFAVAMSFYLSGYKKLAWVMFGIAIVVSFFRVATGIHFPTDVIAGAVLGLIAAYLIQLFDKPLNIVYNFLIKIAKIVRLA
jgi:undecaprenyl-diphosphatase